MEFVKLALNHAFSFLITSCQAKLDQLPIPLFSKSQASRLESTLYAQHDNLAVSFVPGEKQCVDNCIIIKSTRKGNFNLWGYILAEFSPNHN